MADEKGLVVLKPKESGLTIIEEPADPEVVGMPGFLKGYGSFYMKGRSALEEAYDRAIAFLRITQDEELKRRIPIDNLEFNLGRLKQRPKIYTPSLLTNPPEVTESEDRVSLDLIFHQPEEGRIDELYLLVNRLIPEFYRKLRGLDEGLCRAAFAEFPANKLIDDDPNKRLPYRQVVDIGHGQVRVIPHDFFEDGNTGRKYRWGFGGGRSFLIPEWTRKYVWEVQDRETEIFVHDFLLLLVKEQEGWKSLD